MSVLSRILDLKIREVESLRARLDPEELRERGMALHGTRDMLSAVQNCPHVPVIAEIKQASPSKGTLRVIHDVAAMARSYEDAGACAISVLTDERFFNGSLEDVSRVRDAVDIPVLRKDFIIDPVQVYQSRCAGADAILLIAAALESGALAFLHRETLALGMTPLIEVHCEADLEKVLPLQPSLIGINNRDLRTLQIDLGVCRRLNRLVPPGIAVVAESGIRGSEDVRNLRAQGLTAFLVGTTLMQAHDPEETLRELCHAQEG